MSLTPKNWSQFQHYKDRSPAWIKLHRGLLDNREYHLLTPQAAKCLPLIWLLASEDDGLLPATDEMAFRLRITPELAAEVLQELTRREFLVEAAAKTVEHGATLAQRTAKSNGFGNRHISDIVKRLVWARDGGACTACGATEKVEYDHIRPVSKGGNSDLDNIQLLCRACNRSKRVKFATPAQPLRSPEKERENKKEIDGGGGGDAREPPLVSAEATALADEVMAIAGVDREFIPPGWCGASMRIHAMLANGWARETILAGARRGMANKRDGPPESVKYFEKPIAREHAELNKPLPVAQPFEAVHARSRQEPTNYRELAETLIQRARTATAGAEGDGGALLSPGGNVVGLLPQRRGV